MTPGVEKMQLGQIHPARQIGIEGAEHRKVGQNLATGLELTLLTAD
jgi:hypothetical protein